MKKIIFSILCLSFVMVSNTSCQQKVASVSKSDAVNENILSRRSIRKYQPQVVGKDTVEQILTAGINSPSAMNKQPWEVRVVSNPDFLARIKKVSPHFYDAPILIIVANDTSNGFSAFDAGIFTQTVMLSAEGYNLGTVALGMVARALNSGTPEANAILAELDFPANYQVIIGIALGHKAETPAAKPRDASKVKYFE